MAIPNSHPHLKPVTTGSTPRVHIDAERLDPVRVGSSPQGPEARAVLDLQRVAGNAAVSSLFEPTRKAVPHDRTTHTIQRWIGVEHLKLGDAAGQKDVDVGNGVVLTWGQVVAIAGDEYPSLDQLRMDTETDDGKRRIRAALQNAGVVDARSLTSIPAPSPDQLKAQTMTYVNLLLTNAPHFAEGGAIDVWRGHHTTALTLALQAGLALRPSELATANTTEAYGQHFLTDPFSGGHARTPRKAMTDWYVGTFAPQIVDPFLASLKDRLVSEFTFEVFMQLGGAVPAGTVHDAVEKEADKQLAQAVAKIGRDTLVTYFGRGMAGAVGGALHDLEGERGVWVASKAHPDPFQAFGDTLLDDPRNAKNKAQAILAVAAGQEEVNIAYSCGEQEASATGLTPADLPDLIYFPFDSSTLTPAAATLVRNAGQYMARHPETRVEVMGHTDPVGAPGYNHNLGMRRADAVAKVLVANGAQPSRIKTDSAGEEQLVTEDPKQFNLDRRAHLAWGTAASDTDPNTETPFDRANKALQAAVGPPYRRVEDLVPHPVEEISGASANVPLEEWHWGSMAPNLAARLNRWTEHVAPYVGQVLGMVPETQPVDAAAGLIHVTVHPRAAIQKIVNELLANATDFLGRAFGQRASP